MLGDHGVAHLKPAGLARHAMTGTSPTAFKSSACPRRQILQRGTCRRREVVDAVAIAIGTGKAEIGSCSRIEFEGLIGVRGRFIRAKLQTHSDVRREGKHLTEGRSGSTPPAQALRTVFKSGRTFLSDGAQAN